MRVDLSIVRREFSSGNLGSAEQLPTALKDSWYRCASNDMPMEGSVHYQHLNKSDLESSLEQNQSLIHASSPSLKHLRNSISSAGWSILLTDNQCNTLEVLKSGAMSDRRVSSAFFARGLKLDESLVGTTAMSCAIDSKSFSRVYGFEHYKRYHRNFNCAAVPLFNAQGQVCGTLDITNQDPIRDPAAFYLLESCARDIQKNLILNTENALIIELAFPPGQPGDSNCLIMAFNEEQSLVGCNNSAAKFITKELFANEQSFEEIFDTPFNQFKTTDTLCFPVRLTSGIELIARVLKPFSSKESITLDHESARQKQPPINHEFGDRRIFEEIKKASRIIQRLPVMVCGETGTGKEVVANLVHQLSHTKGKLVAINCASLPESLIESELFGYQPGAFTGADKRGHIGKIADADQGTLFLDEIGDMPLELQSRLLRVLESKEVTPLGSRESRKVDFQLICASHVNLETAVSEGKFRQDLYYRLKGYRLNLLPLRDRESVTDLAKSIWADLSDTPALFDVNLAEFFEQYPWPGNTREMKNVLLQMDVLRSHDSTLLEIQDLPQEYQDWYQQYSANATKVYTKQSVITETLPFTHPAHETASEGNKAMLSAIEQANGNMTHAAKALGISRATLYRRVSRLKQKSVSP